jgi:hypothetical protein
MPTRKRSKSQHTKSAGKRKTAARKTASPPKSSTGMRSLDARKTTRSSNRKRAAAAGKSDNVLPGRRRQTPSMQGFDRDLHGEPSAQVVNTRSIEMRSVPPTGIAKERRGKK